MCRVGRALWVTVALTCAVTFNAAVSLSADEVAASAAASTAAPMSDAAALTTLIDNYIVAG